MAAQFRDFVRQTDADGTHLYATLSAAVADDDELLDLADRARPGQRRPNVFFAAVRLLLFRHPDEPLAALHPDIAPEVRPEDVAAGDPAGLLRELCRRRGDELRAELSTRLVQTNEPLRCAALRPGLQAIARREGVTQIGVCDVGTSAGFTLRLDHFGYDYGPGRLSGDLDAPLRLGCELRGPLLPPLSQPLRLAWRAGLDLHPVDVNDPDALSWLRALIWPGDAPRLLRLERAAETARHDPLRLLAGNAVEALPAAVAPAPKELPLVVVTSYALGHFTPEDRQAFAATVAEVARRRPLWWLTTAGATRPDLGGVELRARRLVDGSVVADHLLCAHHPHGRWLEWRDAATADAVTANSLAAD